MSTPPPERGLNTILSRHSVDDTVRKVQSILEAKGVRLFAIIDHSGEAEHVGLTMPNTKLMIFGNPVAGTPLMLAAPSVAIDLPLKFLVAEDHSGAVTITWNEPEHLRLRHNIPQELMSNIAIINALAAAAAG